MFMRRDSMRALVFSFFFSLLLSTVSYAVDSSKPAARITNSVNESNLVRLRGGTHPRAIPEFDQGSVTDSLPMEHIFVVLRRSPEQDQALEGLIAALHDPRSTSYHKWLTADELGRRFGPAQEDIDAVVRWLTSHGLKVNLVHKSGMTIDVTGTAGQVRDAFHTEIHRYNVQGERHIANATDPKIPAALAPVVVGVASLHDFMPQPLVKKIRPAFTFPCTGCPDGFNNTLQFDIAPPDFATIYNVAPLYKAVPPITGKGQTVVVLEITNILASDVAKFRSAFGLSSFSGTFSQIHPGPGCANPGRNDNEGEAALDAEWAGAVAPAANVEVASCANTSTNFGAFIAAQNLLDLKSPPPIMSLSYLGCEAAQGPGGNAFINNLWQQADAEGVSAFIASGDGGPAGCDDFNTSAFAIAGIAANGLGSTTHNFSAGGTDFADTVNGTNNAYWSATNSPTGKSAKSYVPEMTWNDSCAGGVLFTFAGFPSGISFCNSSIGSNFLDIVGGSGAPSFIYNKPAWQAQVFGVPSDGKRDLPDVSLFASNGFWNHALIFCMSDTAQGGTPCDYSKPLDVFGNSAGGTSFTAPQFASIQALINQKAGGSQGNPAPGYYRLAASEYGSPAHPNTATLASCNANKNSGVPNSCFFRDVVRGNIDVPCFGTNNCFLPAGDQFGVLSTTDRALNIAYPAHPGWDFATGLGSPNVTTVVRNWR
jgi:subtilase family serine protease